jgi:drug/metabolite transporter (DMT)-like permease
VWPPRPGGGHLSGRDYAAALAVVVIWGLNFVAMKFALRDFTPFQLGAARYVFAVLPLVLLVKAPPPALEVGAAVRAVPGRGAVRLFVQRAARWA